MSENKEEKRFGNIETRTLSRVPMAERKSWLDVAFIQAGIMICVPSLMLG
jgi:cytosine permease